MKNPYFRWISLPVFALCLAATFPVRAQAASSVSIAGLVRQPLNLTLHDLERMQSVEVQMNEIAMNGDFTGVFRYRGVPLRSILETAWIEKEESDFSSPVDLAVMARNGGGEQVLLSWGEIFFGNPGDILLAYAAEPVMPAKDCRDCHEPDVFGPRLEPLSRTPGFPKLVVAADMWSDRSIEDVNIIQVVDLHLDFPSKRMERLFSGKLSLIGGRGKSRSIDDLKEYPRRTATVHEVGSGRGYHGTMTLEGCPLRSLLAAAGIGPDIKGAFVVSAPDGYRALISSGEIFLGRAGERILVADRRNGAPMEKGGRFSLVTPDDSEAQRWVHAVDTIREVSVETGSRLLVVGIGSGDTGLITQEAVSAMADADVYVCPPDIRRRFGKFMGEKPVLFDLYEFAPPVLRRRHPGISPGELERRMAERREEAAAAIRRALEQGKDVAILEYGDPTLWSGWSWLRAFFDGRIVEIVPGLSSFNASNALIGTDIVCNGSVMLTTPWMIKQDPAVIEAAAGAGTTLCIFMGLSALEELVPIIGRAYTDSTPARLVYKAGYAEDERMVPTTVERLAETAREQEEKYLGLIYVGPCLEGGVRGRCGF